MIRVEPIEEDDKDKRGYTRSPYHDDMVRHEKEVRELKREISYLKRKLRSITNPSNSWELPDFLNQDKIESLKKDLKNYSPFDFEEVMDINYDYICEICGKDCKNGAGMSSHKTIHMKEELVIEKFDLNKIHEETAIEMLQKHPNLTFEELKDIFLEIDSQKLNKIYHDFKKQLVEELPEGIIQLDD